MRVLDLFCGIGGASMGYHMAGFEVVGVDIANQPNYPFQLISKNALSLPIALLRTFDLIHASPPCQHFTAYRRNKSVAEGIEDRYQNLIPPTREMLTHAGVPYVMENLPGSPLRRDLMLCGSMFKTNSSSPFMDVRRHRIFESTFSTPQPKCNHKIWQKRKYKPSSNRTNKRFTIEIGSWDEPLALQKVAMGVNWGVTTRELSEAIPPAYTKYIGEQWLNSK